MPVQKPSMQVIGTQPSALTICGACGTAHVFRLTLAVQFIVINCDLCGSQISWARSDQSISDTAAICAQAKHGC